MTEVYKIGDRVRVQFEGVVTSTNLTFLDRFGHSVEVRRDNGYGHSVRPEDVKEVLGPENWPPQVGDIWEAEGQEWIVRATGAQRMFLAIIDQSVWRNPIGPDFLAKFKALNPTLVRRRDAIVLRMPDDE